MLTFKEKASYGIGRLGSSITIDMADLFTGFVYYAFFGLSEDPFLAFLGVAIGKLVIAFTSYLSGYMSDRTTTRWGRRKPFIIIGAPLLAICFFLLYSPHLFLAGVTDKWTIFTYLLLFNSLYQALYGFLLTPFQAWLPEITSEKERLEVSGYQNTVNLIAFVIGAGTSFLIPAILGASSEEFTPSSFQVANDILPFLTNGMLITVIVLIFAFSVVIFFVPSLIVIHEKEIFIPQPPIREELKVVFSNQNYMSWTLARGVLSIMISGLLGIVLAWIQDVLGFGTVDYLVFGVVLLLSIFTGYLFWARVGSNPKYGKTKSYIYSMLYLALIMPLMMFIGQLEFIPFPVLLQGIVFAILAAGGLSAYYLLPYAIVGDIVEKDERETGESRAGMYYGFESIPLNFFQFIGYLLIGAMIDFLPSVTNYAGRTFSQGYLLFGPLASVIILISVFIFWKFVNADPLQ
ncbi:MAG: MFS transporter [Candidatus Hodarchaeales archaeon]|jgi:GPH family glycoside/pentoside/hexuronide:cation symporter